MSFTPEGTNLSKIISSDFPQKALKEPVVTAVNGRMDTSNSMVLALVGMDLMGDLLSSDPANGLPFGPGKQRPHLGCGSLNS
jgi:hypothetical protein